MVPQATCSPAQTCWLRAWERAKAEKLIPFFVEPGVYSVKSYTVRVVGAGWAQLSCSCPAGSKGRVCKHVAVAAKARSVGVRPLRPLAPSTPAEIAQSEAIKSAVLAEMVNGMSTADPLFTVFN